MTTTMTRPVTATSSVYAVLPATDISRAEHFYHDVLGLEVEKVGTDQLMAHAGGGTHVLVYETRSPHGEATAAMFMVDDLPMAMSDLRSHGVTFEEYDIPEAGLKTIDGIASFENGRTAWFRDSEGNTIALSEMMH